MDGPTWPVISEKASRVCAYHSSCTSLRNFYEALKLLRLIAGREMFCHQRTPTAKTLNRCVIAICNVYSAGQRVGIKLWNGENGFGAIRKDR